MKRAVYNDVDGNGSLNLGDLIILTFSKSITVQPGATAGSVFVLSGGVGATLGTANVTPGGSPNEAQIPLVAGVSFEPNGIFGVDPSSTGINVSTTQTGITSGNSGNPVPASQSPVDIEGSLNPHILQAIFNDVNQDCSVSQGDTLDVLFSRNVNILGTPNSAFQDIPSTSTPFGVNPTYATSTADVSMVTINIDVNPTIEVNGVFDPANPTLGPSGMDIGTSQGEVVDSLFPALVFAEPYTPPGVDVEGTAMARIDRATYTDPGADGLTAGDEIQIDFCGTVDLDPLATPDTAFQLIVAGDTFGTGATFTVSPPPTGATSVTIVLGTAPNLTINGVFDPQNPSAGPSGIDVSAAGLVNVAGTTTAVTPLTPPGIDIGGGIVGGRWMTIPNNMTTARFGHTATLLPNGEILIVGGMHDVASTTNAMFRECLDSIEVFDPTTEQFTPSLGTLVHPRAYHKAVRTAGPDNTIDTPDDYVVIIGGWNSERLDNGGPRSEGTVEVIRPDWNGDGVTDDLVVNPDAAGVAVGTEVADLGTLTFPGVSSACADAAVGLGIMMFDVQWVPEAFAFGGAGNNELIAIGNLSTMFWDDCNGGLAIYFIFFGTFTPATCEDGKLYIEIDSNNDGDLHADTAMGGAGFGGPWTTPVSLARSNYTQSRLPGFDGIDGNLDDAQVVYGGFGFDLTAFCTTQPSQCELADLEFFDWTNLGIYTGVNDSYTPCGLFCTAPGQGATDRELHKAVVTGNAADQIVLVGGAHSNLGTISCGQAVEVITPDFANPVNSTIAYGGLEAVTDRAWNHSGSVLFTTQNALIAGGVDLSVSQTVASAQYVQVAGGVVDPAPDMWEPRDSHAAVSVPAGARPGVTEDRVYIFGGVDRATQWIYVIGDPVNDPATASNTAEYFVE